MNRYQAISGLNLDNDRFFDERIQAVATIQLDLPIDHGQGFLLFHLQATLGQKSDRLHTPTPEGQALERGALQ